MYYAIIGDLVASRRLSPEQRAAAQLELNAALAEVNAAFSGSLAAKFIVTLGDECQGLINSEGDPVSAALMLLHRMRRYPIRLAIGMGGISTSLDGGPAIGADGTAYRRARRAIEQMKVRHGARLRFACGDEELESALNVVAALCDKLASGWTDKQEQAVCAMLTARIAGVKLTQTELAASLGIGQSTVNAQLSAAGYNEYCAGIMHLRHVLASNEV